MHIEDYGIYIKLNIRTHVSEEVREEHSLEFNSLEVIKDWVADNLNPEPEDCFHIIALECKIHSASVYRTNTVVLSGQGLLSKIAIAEATCRNKNV